MGMSQIVLFLMVIVFGFAGCESSIKHVISLEIDEYSGHDIEKNNAARERGFYITIGVGDDEILYKGKRCTVDVLREHIQSDIEAHGLTKEDLSIAPVAIVTWGHSPYSKIIDILDMCAGLGFRVMGNVHTTVYESNSNVESVRNVLFESMPTVFYGFPLDEPSTYSNLVTLDVMEDGLIVMNGECVSAHSPDETRKLFLGLQMEGDLAEVPTYFAIRASKNTDFSHVARVIGYCCSSPKIILLCRNGNMKRSDASRLPTSAYSGIVIGCCTPCAFFWGNLDEAWEQLDLED